MAKLRKKILSLLRRQFLAGVIVIVPLILTFMVLRFLFGGVDNLFSPVIEKLFGTSVPGLGVVATLVLIFLVGVLADNVVGSRLFRLWDILFEKTPLVRTVYGASKQLLEGLAFPDRKSFGKAVLIEYPRKGCYTIGFTAKQIEAKLHGKNQKLVAVYVPSAPTPFTGFALLLPPEEIIPLDLTVEEALKFSVSGGFVSPESFLQAKER